MNICCFMLTLTVAVLAFNKSLKFDVPKNKNKRMKNETNKKKYHNQQTLNFK